MLNHLLLKDFETVSGYVTDIPLSYELFGAELFTAPIVLVNHALTGNSHVAGEGGWWNKVVGKNSVINTDRYTVLSFNIPGNGFDGFLIESYRAFCTKDIVRIFLEGLNLLGIHHLYAIIGGSLGGAIGWEMLAIENDFADKFIPIAADYRTSDWLFSQCLIQSYLLESPDQPLEKARAHAMLCYRTPQSLNQRFRTELNSESLKLKSYEWLEYHGRALNERFSLSAYRLVNHLLMTIGAEEKLLCNISADIHLVGIDSDLFFPASENRKCFEAIKAFKSNIFYHEITSIHGHDAFLMEYDQLNNILKHIF